MAAVYCIISNLIKLCERYKIKGGHTDLPVVRSLTTSPRNNYFSYPMQSYEKLLN